MTMTSKYLLLIMLVVHKYSDDDSCCLVVSRCLGDWLSWCQEPSQGNRW